MELASSAFIVALRTGLCRVVTGTVARVLVSSALIWTSGLGAAEFGLQAGLSGDDAANPLEFGTSVALSGDGNTAIIGGPGDNFGVGAAWVFIRTGNIWIQQGRKLVASDAIGPPGLGTSVALSYDGNTAIVGASGDNGGAGSARIWVRNSGAWTEQAKLVGTGVVGVLAAEQGYAVAISGDGNTAMVGGWLDNGGVGAAWIFVRNGTSWTQQGSKLVGVDAVGLSNQAEAVALSYDGDTAMFGGQTDNSVTGAAWVFTRAGGVWTQQGPKLTASDATSSAYQGSGVALSADGNSAIVGGYGNSSNAGALWLYTRSGGAWTQQGSAFSGTGAQVAARQGSTVALSAGGNVLISGAPGDSPSGAAWIFTRTGNTWTQQGSKLTVGLSENATQGSSVAVSADGNTVITGAPNSNLQLGAAFVYARPNFNMAGTHDLDGDGFSDIVWRDGSGDTAIWLMNGAMVSSSAGVGTVPSGWSVVGQRDFSGDGSADLLWRDTSGDTMIWFMNGTQAYLSASLGNIPASWSVIGTGDFNGDGIGDILWQNANGNLAVWLMSGTTVLSSVGLGSLPTTIWTVAGIGDFNGDGMSDILWRDRAGDTSIWFMNGTQVYSSASIGNVPTNWSVVGIGDFNGDGMRDIVWRDTAGNIAMWLMNGAVVSSASTLGSVPTTWSIALVGDYDGDGMSDLLWRENSGDAAIWFMNGMSVASTAGLGNIPTSWVVQSVNAE